MSDSAFKASIDRAIDRGVTWVSSQQRVDGDWRTAPREADPKELGIYGDQNTHLGESALCLYALRVCNVPAGDQRVVRGFEWARKQYESLRNPRKPSRGLRNYPISLLLLALEAHHESSRAIASGGASEGQAPGDVPLVSKSDIAWMKELTEWLAGAQDGLGGFGYTSPIMMAPHDHSNTQFSLLALGAARRCGIPVPDKVWRKALDHLLDYQEREGPPTVRYEGAGDHAAEDGYGTSPRATAAKDSEDRSRGWGYRDGDPATGSMSAGGVSSIALCMEALSVNGQLGPTLRKRSEQSIRDGIAWLGQHFSVRDNPGPEGAPCAHELWHYYHLFGIERAGDLAGVRYMGKQDWYLEGARFLIDSQGADGAWARAVPQVDGRGPRGGTVRVSGNLHDTCFALLFLKRAMLRQAEGTPTAEGRIDLSGASGLTEEDYRDLFDAVFARYAKAEATARPERATDFVRLGVRSLPLLVLRLEDPKQELREAAIAALKHFTGLTQGFDPKAPENARAAAVRAWEGWWLAHKDRLVADIEAGRFLEK